MVYADCRAFRIGRLRDSRSRHRHHRHLLHCPDLHKLRLDNRVQPAHQPWHRRFALVLHDFDRIHGPASDILATLTTMLLLVGGVGPTDQCGSIAFLGLGICDDFLPTDEGAGSGKHELECGYFRGCVGSKPGVLVQGEREVCWASDVGQKG